MELQIIEHDFSICKINNTAQVNFSDEFVFLSKTDDEISLVCRSFCVPPSVSALDAGWKALKISGILDFGMVGVLAGIAVVLAEAGVSIFAVSTYNTDYIFVKSQNLEKSVQILMNNGYTIESANRRNNV